LLEPLKVSVSVLFVGFVDSAFSELAVVVALHFGVAPRKPSVERNLSTW
jgi:hypothetical protein